MKRNYLCLYRPCFSLSHSPEPGNHSYDGKVQPRCSSSELTDYTAMSSDEGDLEEEENFGDDELTDGRSGADYYIIRNRVLVHISQSS